MTDKQPEFCADGAGHDFQPKRQIALKDGADISELYCRRCGVVCIVGSRDQQSPNLIRRV